jgi:hypothetical protein
MVPLPLVQQLSAGPGPGGRGGCPTTQLYLLAMKFNGLGCLNITLESLTKKEKKTFFNVSYLGGKCHGGLMDVRGQLVGTYTLLLPRAIEHQYPLSLPVHPAVPPPPFLNVSSTWQENRVLASGYPFSLELVTLLPLSQPVINTN